MVDETEFTATHTTPDSLSINYYLSKMNMVNKIEFTRILRINYFSCSFLFGCGFFDTPTIVGLNSLSYMVKPL